MYLERFRRFRWPFPGGWPILRSSSVVRVDVVDVQIRQRLCWRVFCWTGIPNDRSIGHSDRTPPRRDIAARKGLRTRNNRSFKWLVAP